MITIVVHVWPVKPQFKETKMHRWLKHLAGKMSRTPHSVSLSTSQPELRLKAEAKQPEKPSPKQSEADADSLLPSYSELASGETEDVQCRDVKDE